MFRLDGRSRREIKQLLDDIGKLARIVDADCRDEFQAVAGSVANEARSRAPRLSGKLRDSIHETVTGADQDPAVVVDVPYAAIQDRGGRHPVFGRGSVTQAPTHFMTDAVESHDREFMKAADQAVTSAARKIGFR